MLILEKKTDLDDKPKKLNKKVTSNKTNYALVENELNKISKKVETISTKELTNDLINIVFLMVQKIFLQKHYKIIWHFIS